MKTGYNRDDGPANSMNIFDERYYSFNKRILCAVGLWPYQSLPARAVRVFVLLFFSFTIMVPQVEIVTRLSILSRTRYYSRTSVIRTGLVQILFWDFRYAEKQKIAGSIERRSDTSSELVRSSFGENTAWFC